jgi:two-component system, NtrC family, nitrogen regulation sensor histidine kinase NtrY
VNFRRKLLAVFALTVVVCVAAVAWIISGVTRRVFEHQDEQRTAALIAQFQRGYDHRAADIIRRLDVIASSESATRVALSVSRSPSETSSFLNEAAPLAEGQRLDFLEFVDADNHILSSAQAPARFGYPETSIRDLAALDGKAPFLKQEELPDGMVLGLFAVRSTKVSDRPVYIIGGERVDRSFLASIELPAGMHAALYQATSPGFSPQLLTSPGANWSSLDQLAALVTQVETSGTESSQLIHWSSDTADDETVDAIPLKGQDGKTLGMLLVSSSRRPYVELKRHIEQSALFVGGAGILVAILLSSRAAARVTRPIEQLATAAREVAAGDLTTHVDIVSSDEIGELAHAFNCMTNELLEQKERLVQTERVAAWRELARRLAHELKNPLFPLQLTVENLIRAREHSPQIFEEIFQESSATLLAEISNLKAIIGRFGEFSRMPQPVFQRVDLNELVHGVGRLYQAQFRTGEATAIEYQLNLDANLAPIAADPQLLHRALSNLVLNAMDAMPGGGTLTLRTSATSNGVMLEASDTGTGLSPEEAERIFTPYYTSKQHGSGLGLAIVQSVISDHHGKISVRSEPGRGVTFLIELPSNLDKLSATPASDAPAAEQRMYP